MNWSHLARPYSTSSLVSLLPLSIPYNLTSSGLKTQFRLHHFLTQNKIHIPYSHVHGPACLVLNTLSPPAPATPAHLALATLVTFLFLKHAKSLPTSGPWHQLFPLPGKLRPQRFTQLSTSATPGSGHTSAYSREGPSLPTQRRAHPCLHLQRLSPPHPSPPAFLGLSTHLHLTPCF